MFLSGRHSYDGAEFIEIWNFDGEKTCSARIHRNTSPTSHFTYQIHPIGADWVCEREFAENKILIVLKPFNWQVKTYNDFLERNLTIWDIL